MSARALLKAVETRLRSAVVLNDPAGRVCGVQADGRPPAACGQLYYAVHWGGATAGTDGTIAETVDAYHQVTVTVTARMGVAPADRQGAKISTPGDLIDLAEALAAPGVLSGNYAEVMNAANALIDGAGVTTNGFEEPLLWLGTGNVVRKGADWVGSKESGDVFAIDVRFGKARRLQVG